jgi:hypothetical protein
MIEIQSSACRACGGIDPSFHVARSRCRQAGARRDHAAWRPSGLIMLTGAARSGSPVHTELSRSRSPPRPRSGSPSPPNRDSGPHRFATATRMSRSILPGPCQASPPPRTSTARPTCHRRDPPLSPEFNAPGRRMMRHPRIRQDHRASIATRTPEHSTSRGKHSVADPFIHRDHPDDLGMI